MCNRETNTYVGSDYVDGDEISGLCRRCEGILSLIVANKTAIFRELVEGYTINHAIAIRDLLNDLIDQELIADHMFKKQVIDE
jgi:hypothetical protein